MACPASLRPDGRATSPTTTTLGEALVAAAMVLSLLIGTATALARLALDLPLAMLCAFRTAVAAGRPPCPDPPVSVLYYTGTVRHIRRKPAKHAFR
jgi:ABC-type amino acid transport system permease subunit